MAKREWIGNYKLYYSEYLSYKNTWVSKQTDLGYCLSVQEACEKAVNFIVRESITVDYDTMYVRDGFGNNFYAKEN